MKKILVFLVIMGLTLPAFAMEVNYQTHEGKIQERVSEIGFKILNANNLNHRVVFYYKSKIPMLNAVSYYDSKSVSVFKGIMPFVQSDDELAGIIAHEIAHQTEFQKGYWHTVGTSFAPRKYEYKADLVGVDLMVKAGYNPLGFIAYMNKTFYQTSAWREIFDTHPLPSKRMMEIYEHVYLKYPEYLASNDYKDNIYYQNFLITSKDSRKKFESKLKM